MFSWLFSLFWRSDPIAELSLDEAYKIANESKPKPPREVVKKEEEINDYETCTKVGKITSKSDDYFIVDNFVFKSDLDGLRVGSKISYQILKDAGKFQVVNVNLLENEWDNHVDTSKHSWCTRTLITKVDNRNGRNLVLNPGNLRVDLNQVRSEFIPIEGDWVELEVKCQLDEKVTDLTGQVLEVERLMPLRPQIKSGRVTKWNAIEKCGVIDRNIFFEQTALWNGYIPVFGDDVVAEIIESDQGICTWRALKLIPEYLHNRKTRNGIVTKLTENFVEDHSELDISKNLNLTFKKLGESTIFTIKIHNKSEIECFVLEKTDLPKSHQCRILNKLENINLKPDTLLPIQLECIAKSIGETREIVLFHFENFTIGRWVHIAVENNANLSNKNVGQYKRNTRFSNINENSERELIRGQRQKPAPRFTYLTIPEYPVPQRILELLVKYESQQTRNFRDLKSELEKMKPVLTSNLTYLNYEDKFHCLLHLEEISTVLAMKNYDQERACFVRFGEYLLLEIENLSERRPSIIIGDRVIARSIFNPKSPDFEGYVHKVTQKHVHLKFSSIFHDSYNGDDYAVTVIASRTSFKRKHYATTLAVKNLGKDFLFPPKIVEKPDQIKLQDEMWYNKDLNHYQKEAIRNALKGKSRPLPYIIFGPPGTGKTVTLVETILQILRFVPHSRLLVAAPSNSAADLIALRLIDTNVLKPGDLVRLVAFTAIPNIPAKLAPFSVVGTNEKSGTETGESTILSNGLIVGCNSAVLGRHRITICTCSSAGSLLTMGFTKGQFSHIIVDETGQTTEASVLIPLSFLDTASGQAILAGDPMQLGPVILSTLARDYGLEESFLERMIHRFPYIRDPVGFPNSNGYDPRLVTKLIYNYRSLPSLLKLPSYLFYNDELIPTLSDSDSREAYILDMLSEMIPNDNETVPSIVFHGVTGENFQTEDSPSWFNPNEAAQVFFYVNECYRLGLKSPDIGIITPYKAQSKVLGELLKEAEFDLPKIGTVEEFQGQEYNVIILSTVRSNQETLDRDLRFKLGFLSNPRRLNVSITRAKVLLIVVGNPYLLYNDKYWRAVIDYCIEKGGYTGCEIFQ